MLEIPFDGFSDTHFKRRLRVPAHFCFDLVRRNGVPSVMAFPVFYKGDQFIADICLSGIAVRKHFLQCIQDRVDDLQILTLVMAADIVGLK